MTTALEDLKALQRECEEAGEPDSASGNLGSPMSHQIGKLLKLIIEKFEAHERDSVFTVNEAIRGIESNFGATGQVSVLQNLRALVSHEDRHE